MKNLFEHEEEKNYYKPVRVSNFYTKNYIEYQSSGDRNTISWKYLNKVRPYLNGIINNLKQSYSREIQLAIGNNFISSTENTE